jgi:hypothetical protein
MFGNKKDDRDGAKRSTVSRFLPVLAAMILMLPVQSAYSAAPVTSGSVHMGNTFLGAGNTGYSIDYSYPSTADVGTNLTVTVTLHVDSLTGLIEYMINWNIDVNVYIAGQVPLTGAVQAPNGGLFEYPGVSLGPFNLTIPLTVANTGLAQGQSANATVSVTYGDVVWIGGLFVYYATEPIMQGAAGSLLIQNPAASTSTSTSHSTAGQGAGQTYVPYALLASGAVLMASAVLLRRGPQPPK